MVAAEAGGGLGESSASSSTQALMSDDDVDETEAAEEEEPQAPPEVLERGPSQEAGLWMHATSDANLAIICSKGYLQAHGNNATSARYDRILTYKHAPHGVWFNAHYMADGNMLQKTQYPEKCVDATVKGLVASVHDLLTYGGTDVDLRWELFLVSEHYAQGGSRGVNYACASKGSPAHSWLVERAGRDGPLERAEGVTADGVYTVNHQLLWAPSGQSVRVELRYANGKWAWDAIALRRDATCRFRSTRIAVFLIADYIPSDHSTFPRGCLPLEWFRSNVRELEHVSDPAKAKSSGALVDGSGGGRMLPLFHVPPVPSTFVKPGQLDALLAELVGTGRIFGLAARAGIGKSTAAAWAARQATEDGAFTAVYWLQFSRDAKALSLLRSLVTDLGCGEQVERRDLRGRGKQVEQASDEKLVALLVMNLRERGRVLLVLDDVWTPAQIEPFKNLALKLSRSLTLLFTTRKVDLFDGDTRLGISRLSETEAGRLLVHLCCGSKKEHSQDRKAMRAEAGFTTLLAKCKGLPALVRSVSTLCNSSTCASVLERWSRIVEAGVAPAPPQTVATDEYGDLFSAYQLQFDSLLLRDRELAEGFAKLAIFPEDDQVPIWLLCQLWCVDSEEGAERSRQLEAESLCERRVIDETGEDAVVLIDAVGDFLRCRAGKPTMAAWHAELLRECLDEEEIGAWAWCGSGGYWEGHEGAKRFVDHALLADFGGGDDVDYGTLAGVKSLDLGTGDDGLLWDWDLDEDTDFSWAPLVPLIAAMRNLEHISFQSSRRSYQIPISVQEQSQSRFPESVDNDWLPASLTSIGANAFGGISWIHTVKLRHTNVAMIDHCTFAYCTSLKKVELPAGLKSIGAEAFIGCVALAFIELPSGLTSIGLEAFKGCEVLRVAIPDGLARSDVASNAFDGCADVKYPESWTAESEWRLRVAAARAVVMAAGGAGGGKGGGEGGGEGGDEGGGGEGSGEGGVGEGGGEGGCGAGGGGEGIATSSRNTSTESAAISAASDAAPSGAIAAAPSTLPAVFVAAAAAATPAIQQSYRQWRRDRGRGRGRGATSTAASRPDTDDELEEGEIR